MNNIIEPENRLRNAANELARLYTEIKHNKVRFSMQNVDFYLDDIRLTSTEIRRYLKRKRSI